MGTNTASTDSASNLDYLVYWLDGYQHTTVVPHDEAKRIVSNPRVNLMTWLPYDRETKLARDFVEDIE